MKLRLLTLGLVCSVLQLRADHNVGQVVNTTILNPSCPVELLGVAADRKNDARQRVAVEIRNQRERRVVAVKVAFSGWDAAWDLHDIPETYAAAVSLRSEKKTQIVWKMKSAEFLSDIDGGLRVVLVKLLYSDGSTWQDDGANGCSLAIKGEARPDTNWK